MAAVAAVAGGTAAVVVPGASAAPGNIVTFGDSFSANPDQVRNGLRGVPGIDALLGSYQETGGCLQSEDNWPRQLGEKKGRKVADWSCTAQTSGSMLGRVDAAIAAGDVKNNSTVVMAIGMNDFGGFGVVDNQNLALLDPAAVQRDYIGNLKSAAEKIRKVAPDARFVVSGALPTVDRDSATFCPVNVVPNQPAGIPVPLLRDVENWNRGNQQLAAKAIGGTYVEMIDGARGHDTCAPDNQRYVAGIVDTTTPNYHMAFHPSHAGSEYMADRLAANV